MDHPYYTGSLSRALRVHRFCQEIKRIEMPIDVAAEAALLLGMRAFALKGRFVGRRCVQFITLLSLNFVHAMGAMPQVADTSPKGA